MYSAVFASLADERFMDRFFADPRSFELIDSRLVELMIACSRPFVEGLVSRHWGWLLELLLRSGGVRQAVSTSTPELVFAAAQVDVDRFTQALTPEWREDLRIGLERVGPIGQASIRDAFGGAFEVFENSPQRQEAAP
jgi:hypothetical protein